MTQTAITQVVGGHDNSNLLPAEAKPSTLTNGGLVGDVNLFTGDYNTSVPLGSVGTPGGLNYSLNLSYSTTYTAGTSPMVASGIPYGEGWNLSLPSISISNAAFYAFLQHVECSYKTSPEVDTNLNYHSLGTAQVNGDVYWFSPVVKIPGYANGKAVFKYMDGYKAVFVLNKFDKYVKLTYYNGIWEAKLDNGDVYTFRDALTTYRSPNNQRILNYDYSDHQSNNQTYDVTAASDYGITQQSVKNVIEPKEVYTSWYCSKIENRNIPHQSILFDYEKFGQFNFFQEYNQYQVANAIGDKLLSLTDPSGGFPKNFDVYTDILLKSVISYDLATPVDILELEYETSGMYSTNMLHPDQPGVSRKDSLYNYKTIYQQGGNSNFNSDWNRYLHGKADGISGKSQRALNPTNPYEISNNSNSYLRQTSIGGASNIGFNHGYLESSRINQTNLISGDTYELRTKIKDYNGNDFQMGNGTVDIAVVTGDMNVNLGNQIDTIIPNPQGDVIVFGPQQFSYDTYSQLNNNFVLSPNYYNKNDYQATRGDQIYSTFNNAVKWQINTSDTLVTSSVFVMPSLPESNQGINIQIGPGNSDHVFNKEPLLQTGEQIKLSDTEASAYSGYAHMTPLKMASYADIPANFGIGMPWAMTLPLYADEMGGTNSTDPKLSNYAKFWWNDETVSVHEWPNEPTKFNDQVKLESVELIRYSKNPYMLKHAKLYKTNGETDHLENTGKILVNNIELEYDMNSQRLYENYEYPINSYDQYVASSAVLDENGNPIGSAIDSILISGETQNIILDSMLVQSETHYQYVYELTKVKNIPTGHFNDDTLYNPDIPEEELLQTDFKYKWFGGHSRNSSESGFTGVINPGRSTRIMTKIVDQLGGETEIEYYPRHSLATLTGGYGLSHKGGCNTATYVSRSYASNRATIVHPSVKSITTNENLATPQAYRSDIFNPMYKKVDYIYDTTKIIYETSDITLPANFRKAFKYSYSKGFENTTVLDSELETGERNYTKYYHHGNVFTPYYNSSTQEIVFDNSTIEEYLYFGKLRKVEQYNSSDNIESSIEYDYEHTLAYLNGYERNHTKRSSNLINEDIAPFVGVANDLTNASYDYEYGDIYRNETELKDSIDFKGLSQTWDGRHEAAGFAGVYFYNDIKAINDDWKLHSYFVKLASKSTKTYDQTCSKEAKVFPASEVLNEFTISPNPFGNGPTNPTIFSAVKDPDHITSIINSTTGTDIKDSLIVDSPLSDSVLNAFIDHMADFDQDVVYEVLRVQNPFNEAYLKRVFDNTLSLSPNQIIEIFRSQPYITDNIQKHIIENHEYSQNEILTAILNHNAYLSDNVLTSLIEQEAFPEPVLYDVLTAQPQLNHNTLLTLSNTNSQVGGANVAKVLAVQPAVPDDVFNKVIDNNSFSEAIKVQILNESVSYPSETVLMDFITSELSTNDIVKIALACPYDMSDDLEIHIKDIIGQNNWQTIEPIQKDLNPYELYCHNLSTCNDSYIENIEEYSYYEADYRGHTLAEGYKKLMGLEDVEGKAVNDAGLNMTLQDIILKHEPSWQLFSVNQYSPQYPGAYKKQEYFYYFDELNRLDRHIQFYDLEKNKAWFSTGHATFFDTVVTIAGHTDFYAEPNIEPGAIPLSDGARNAQKNLLRNLAFQKTTFSKNNNDEAPLMQSSYYYYESKWKVPQLADSTEVVYYSGAPCPPVIPPNPCDANAILAWAHGNAAAISTIEDNTPLGYCAYHFDPPFGPIYYVEDDVNIENCGSAYYHYSYTQVHCNDGTVSTGDGSVEEPLFLTPPVWKNYLFLKNVAVQIDTIPNTSTDWNFRLDDDNSYIAYFLAGEKDSNNLTVNSMIYPFDTLGVRTIDKVNRYGQIELEHDQSGIYTKYNYNLHKRIWHINSNNNANCPGEGNYGSIINTNIGLPTSIIVGYNRSDSLRTDYEYYPNYAIKSITDPNGIELKYEYDQYNRLHKSYENDRLLGQNKYSYWKRDSTYAFSARTNQNYVESYLYNSALPTTGYNGLHSLSYIDIYGRNIHSVTASNNDSVVVHSGAMKLDNWNRILQQLKPEVSFGNSNGNLDFTGELTGDYQEFSYENNTKGRLLRRAVFGINNINSTHTVKQNYSFVNKVQLACDLDLSKNEIHLLVNDEFSGDPRFIKHELEDEDGKQMITYSNAVGQKIANLQYGENSLDKVVTLFAYDSYGNLNQVINPKKQVSKYNYNILGQPYLQETIDGGKTKFMYNKQGQLAVKQTENGKAGEYFEQEQDTLPYYTRYEYDDFGRLTAQKKAYRNRLVWNVDNSKVDPLFFKDTISGIDPDYGTPVMNAYNQTQDYFDYHFSNQSTYSWLAKVNLVVDKPHPVGLDSGTVLVTDLMTSDLAEKIIQYGGSNADNTLGKVKFMTSCDKEGNSIQVTQFTYDTEGNIATELISFTGSVANANNTVTAKIHYPDYNYQRSLKKMEVDIDNNGIIDFQYHYDFDDWNRLKKVYFNFANQESEKVLITAYDYDYVTGQNTAIRHYQTEVCDPGGETYSVTPNQLIQTINKAYDVRYRLTDQTSELLDIKLYYDNNTPGTYLNQTVTASKNWNGNINAMSVDYKTDNSALSVFNSPASTFSEKTDYGYTYDNLNRLVQADATVGNFINNSTATYGIGDAFYSYDKIGNFTHLQRGVRDTVINGQGVLINDDWNYTYNNANNQLTSVDAQNSYTLTRNYTYDKNGNLLTDDYRALDSVTYYRDNYPYQISKPNLLIDYLYSNDDQRIYKHTLNSISNTTETEEFYLKNIGILDMVSGNWTYYVTGLGQEAKIIPNSEQTPTAITNAGDYNPQHAGDLDISFYITDYLGNTRLVYSPIDNCTSSNTDYSIRYVADFYPYGKVLREFSQGEKERFLTTEHERDRETGLDYRGARFYDSDVSRFLSLDPLASQYPSLSDYTYVASNPILYTDPTGMAVETRYKDKITGELIEDVNDGYDQDTYVDRDQFKLVRDYAARSGLDFKNQFHARYFTDQYTGWGKVGQQLGLYSSHKSDQQWRNFYSNDMSSIDPAGGMYVHVELAVLEFVTINKYLGVAFRGVKYAFLGSTTTSTGTKLAYNLGVAGERAVGVSTKTRIPSLTGTASYRIPDIITSTTLTEVKNVAHQSLTRQLKDFLLFSQQTGREFVLYTRSTTTFSAPLQNLINQGKVVVKTIPGM